MSANDVKEVEEAIERIMGKYAVRMIATVATVVAVAAGAWALNKRDVEDLKAAEQRNRTTIQEHTNALANHEWRIKYIETHP